MGVILNPQRHSLAENDFTNRREWFPGTHIPDQIVGLHEKETLRLLLLPGDKAGDQNMA